MKTTLARIAAPLLVLALGTLLPRAAVACAVCVSGREGGTKKAFIAGSLLISTLPFFTIGSLVFYVRRRAKQEEKRDAERSGARSVAVGVAAEQARA